MAFLSIAPSLPVRLSLRHLRRVLLPAAVLLLAGGCASMAPPSYTAHPTAQSLRLQVQNQNATGMVIYSVQQGGRVRLGEVAARETRDFDLRISVRGPTGALRLYAEPARLGPGFLVAPVEAAPGDQVRLILDNDARHSQVLVQSGDSWNDGRMARNGGGDATH